jgi:HEAT repeat protein
MKTKQQLRGAALALSAFGLFAAPAIGHGGGYFGGSYKGPGDTVPPGGAGGSSGPGGPAVGGPSTPMGGPGGPNAPGPASPGTSLGGTATAAAAPGTPTIDLTVWQYWWMFNKAPYLDLKAHIYDGVVTGSEGFFLGEGPSLTSRDMLRPSQQVVRQRIVPALLRALEREASDDIVTSALIALAKIGDAEGSEQSFAEAIKPFLTHGSQEVAETAAVALGILANDANVPLLVDLLRADVARLRSEHELSFTSEVALSSRAFAAFGLGLVGSRTANEEVRQRIVAACCELLEGEGRRLGTRDIQVGCLTTIGLTPLALAEAEGEGAERGVPLSRRGQVEWLIGYYRDAQNNHLLRAQVPTALARLLVGVEGELRERAAKLLIDDLGRHSKQPVEMQQSCALALGRIADSDEDPLDVAVRQALMQVRETCPDQQTRNFALIALAQAASRPGAGEGNPIAGVSKSDKQPGARAFLAEQLFEGKQGVRPWAAIALAILERNLADAGQATSPEIRAALREKLGQATSPDEVGGFAIALGIARDAESTALLLEKLDQIKDVEARGFVAVALGLVEARSAIEPIELLVRKSRFQTELLQAAAIALGLLGDKELVPDLVAMLQEANSLSAQAAISTGLGHIGDARSIEPLLALFEDQEKTALARAFAGVALGIVADKDDLPWNSRISVDINYRANTPTLVSPGTGRGILDIL